MNTITNISNKEGVGVYRHVETGFTIHDIWSVNEAISANGVIAMDMESGSWSWVAGEDLFVEIYKRGGNTLGNLARNLLSQIWTLCFTRICYGTYWRGPTIEEDRLGHMFMTGKLPTSRTVGGDVRLFGVHTNLQAGRGLSTDLIDSTIRSMNEGGTGTYGTYGQIKGDFPNHEGRTVGLHSLYKSLMYGGPTYTNTSYGKSENVIGRAIIALPLKSWSEFLTRWKASLPNASENEVQERADAAIAKFSSVFQNKLFMVPSVRIPVVLTRDGRAYIDNNPTRSIIASGTVAGEVVGRRQAYNPLVSPTIVDESGLWVTNPCCAAPGEAHSLLKILHTGMDRNVQSPGAAIPSNEFSNMTLPMNMINKIGGVDLFKIAGGFYPRVDAVSAAKSESELIAMVFRANHDDQSLPVQNGGETIEAYNARMETFNSASSYSHLSTNYGHWHLAGQVVLLVTTILDACLQGKSIHGKDLFTCGSGNLCRHMRVQNHALIEPALVADIESDLDTYLTHQYGG